VAISRLILGAGIAFGGAVGAVGVAHFMGTDVAETFRDTLGPPVTPFPVVPRLRLRASCPANTARDYFFPLELQTRPHEWEFGGDSDRSSPLRAMNEPSLSCASRDVDEEYRLLWTRSKRLEPVIVRVTRRGDAMELVGLVVMGGRAVEDTHRAIARKDWDDITHRIAGLAFWALDPFERGPGVDGSSFLLEGRKGDKYHVLDRDAPDRGAYSDLCNRFLELARFSTLGE
jgi:hypothetical protein